MSKLEDIDPLFSKEGRGKEEPQFHLEDIDPIFKIEEKKAPTATAASEKDFMSWLADKVEPKTLESAGAALAGAYLNPKIQGAATNISQAVASGAPSRTPVQKWGDAMGISDRGQPTMAKAYEAESGVRKGATIGGKTPTFNVQRPPVVTPPPVGALQQTKNVLGTAGNVMASVPRATGALAGLGAVEGMQDAQSRYKQGDIAGAAIAGAGGIGSLASMIPHPVTRAIGAGVGMASPAALMVLDKMRQMPRQPQQALQNTDAMGNPMQ
jgi:hypothetical protein